MKPNQPPSSGRPFWLNALILVAGASLASYVLSRITEISLSNFYFLIGIVLLIISVVPIFSEVGGNARVGVKARQAGKPIREAIADREKSGRYDQGTRVTFLYGICGFICFILAVATG